MEGIVLKYPELRQFSLLHHLEEYSPLSWLGIIASSLSILVAAYILLFQLKPSWSKLKYDAHFQLRFTVVIMLIVNCILNLAHLVMAYYHVSIRSVWWRMEWSLYLNHNQPIVKQLFEQKTYELRNAQRIVYSFLVAFLCTLNVMLILMLFLTMNRYKRVALVLPQSFEFKVCKCIQIMAILIALYNIITLSLQQIIGPEGIKEEYLILIDDKMYFKVGSFAFFYIIYYVFTVKLIVLSVRSGRITTQGFFQKIFNWIWKRQSSPPQSLSALNEPLEKSHGQSNEAQSQLNENVDIQDAQVVHLKRLHAGIKMIGIFVLLSLVDFFIFSFLAYSHISKFYDGIQSVSLSAFATSWIVVHIWCVFLLLDMFVQDLMRANRREQSRFRTRFVTMINRFWRGFWKLTSTRDSARTDIVDLSLISGTNLTTFKNSEGEHSFLKKTAISTANTSALECTVDSHFSKLQSLPSSSAFGS